MDISVLKERINQENCDMRYLSGFLASDPYLYLCKRDGAECLIVASMEELRATRESRCPVISRTAAGFTKYIEDGCKTDEAAAKMLKTCCTGAPETRCRLLVP